MDKALFLTADGNRTFPVKEVAVCGNTAPAAMGFFPGAAGTVQAAAVLVFPSFAAGSLGTLMLNINPSTLFFLQGCFRSPVSLFLDMQINNLTEIIYLIADCS